MSARGLGARASPDRSAIWLGLSPVGFGQYVSFSGGLEMSEQQRKVGRCAIATIGACTERYETDSVHLIAVYLGHREQ
ncbi:hypothetical protein AWB74_02390 [Caballeronia arvi]|uniref:Uncharacterized protein n=1 Tax=Caballeronia arvi TaxID=1777135 RepID=A0A158I6R6_9BURK|nr:hypothetical protein AWB74_02390 [Caballeronia arvi]